MKTISFLILLLASLSAKSQTSEALRLKDAFKVAIIQKKELNEKDIETYNQLLLKSGKKGSKLEKSIKSQIDSFKSTAALQKYSIGMNVDLTGYNKRRKCYYLNLKNEIVNDLGTGIKLISKLGKLEEVVIPLNKVENMMQTSMDSVRIKKIYAEYEFVIDTSNKVFDDKLGGEKVYYAYFKTNIIRLYKDSSKQQKLDEIDQNEPKVRVVPDVSFAVVESTGIVEAPKESEDYQRVFITAQIEPEFPGGEKAWAKFLENNLNKNVAVENRAPNGKYTVVLSFIVAKDGKISEIIAENDPGYETKQEAIRLMKKVPLFKPAIQNGRNVHFRQRLAITFTVGTK